LANNESEVEKAKELLIHVLTRRRGEFLFQLGAQPPRDKLLANGDLSGTADWHGAERTEMEIHLLINALRAAVEEIGGKVGVIRVHALTRLILCQAAVLFEAVGEHPRASVLLRLPPADVSSTTEVRCAIVGNVDSGKSTTLGVLTRGKSKRIYFRTRYESYLGGLDDGRGLARVVLFRHKHEIETGRTSSVGMEVRHYSLQH
jgi:GTPase